MAPLVLYPAPATLTATDPVTRLRVIGALLGGLPVGGEGRYSWVQDATNLAYQVTVGTGAEHMLAQWDRLVAAAPDSYLQTVTDQLAA